MAPSRSLGSSGVLELIDCCIIMSCHGFLSVIQYSRLPLRCSQSLMYQGPPHRLVQFIIYSLFTSWRTLDQGYRVVCQTYPCTDKNYTLYWHSLHFFCYVLYFKAKSCSANVWPVFLCYHGNGMTKKCFDFWNRQYPHGQALV